MAEPPLRLLLRSDAVRIVEQADQAEDRSGQKMAPLERLYGLRRKPLDASLRDPQAQLRDP